LLVYVIFSNVMYAIRRLVQCFVVTDIQNEWTDWQVHKAWK